MAKHRKPPAPPSDPFFDREAQKYAKPIPSRELIMSLLDEAGRPLDRLQLQQLLALDEDEEAIEALRRRLGAMVRDGQLLQNRRGEFGLAKRMDLISGRIIGHPDGFGFLVPDDGSDDLFLSARDMQTVMHGDRALVRVTGIDRRQRREAAVVEILDRAHKQVAGHYRSEGGVGFLVPDNKRLSQDILIPPDKSYGAHDGQLVVAEILHYPTRLRQAIGRVVEILGDNLAPGMEIDIAIRSHSIPHLWSELVEYENDRLPAEVPEAAKGGRVDLRHLPLVTIDGEDSMDFDDAVFAEPFADGWRLLVAIADVSHYVTPGSPLDAEARLRGNSVYFPGRVVPMLPENLSNGLCSLNPHVDRLCMVCDLQIDAEGGVLSFRFYPAVMQSQARLTYTQVAAMLCDHDQPLREQFAPIVPMLEQLYALYKKLLARRWQRGAIDFETSETKIVFGEGKKIERIVAATRNDAHRLIEECMLLANTAAATFLANAKVPILYRVHEGPKSDKLTDLRQFLAELGLQLGGGDRPAPADYARLLHSVQQRADAQLIQTVLLRSMSQAVYSPENHGHFGLAFSAYTHFTSPIRRYPDLLVHRAIRHLLSGQGAERFIYGWADMQGMGEQCSMTERRADEATRDVVDWLKCEYMQDRVGECFDGVISSVTSFGLFVMLEQVFVEGLVHITQLAGDYYHFDPAHHRLLGERTRRIWRLGDKLRVKVARVDLETRKIDFALADEAGINDSSERKPKGGGRGRKRR
jgi:ribonuclease R